jgi:hypothetical protein
MSGDPEQEYFAEDGPVVSSPVEFMNARILSRSCEIASFASRSCLTYSPGLADQHQELLVFDPVLWLQ